jgi:tetratricopeptide (TPR) repeat protein
MLMDKSLLRIVSLLLVACMAAQTATAGYEFRAMSNESKVCSGVLCHQLITRNSALGTAFEEQALVARRFCYEHSREFITKPFGGIGRFLTHRKTGHSGSASSRGRRFSFGWISFPNPFYVPAYATAEGWAFPGFGRPAIRLPHLFFSTTDDGNLSGSPGGTSAPGYDPRITELRRTLLRDNKEFVKFVNSMKLTAKQNAGLSGPADEYFDVVQNMLTKARLSTRTGKKEELLRSALQLIQQEISLFSLLQDIDGRQQYLRMSDAARAQPGEFRLPYSDGYVTQINHTAADAALRTLIGNGVIESFADAIITFVRKLRNAETWLQVIMSGGDTAVPAASLPPRFTPEEAGPSSVPGSIGAMARQPYQEAVKLYAAGEYGAAITKLNEAIAMDGRYAAAVLSRGQTYLEVGRPEKTLEDAESVIAMYERSNPEPHEYILRIKALAALERYPEAERYLQEAITMFPDNIKIIQAGVHIYNQRDEHDKARAFAQPVVGLQPGTWTETVSLAQILHDTGDYVRAKELLLSNPRALEQDRKARSLLAEIERDLAVKSPGSGTAGSPGGSPKDVPRELAAYEELAKTPSAAHAAIPFSPGGMINEPQLKDLPVVKEIESCLEKDRDEDAMALLREWMQFNRATRKWFKYEKGHLEESRPVVVSSRVEAVGSGRIELVLTNGWGITHRLTFDKKDGRAVTEIRQRIANVFEFGGQATPENDPAMLAFLGNKGYQLAGMTNLGFPVPAGFTILDDETRQIAVDNKIRKELRQAIESGVGRIEKEASHDIEAPQRFGDPENLLLLAVRAGARVSDPGKFLTVNKVGLHHSNLEAYAKILGNPFQARMDYLRFMYEYLLSVDGRKYEEAQPIRQLFCHNKFYAEYASHRFEALSRQGTLGELDSLVNQAGAKYKEITGREFPSPREQLDEAIVAVAAKYPKDVEGQGINVQWQVLGNINDGESLSGVLFSRDPLNGEKEIVGTYGFAMEGKDIVQPYGYSGVYRRPVYQYPDESAKVMRYKDLRDRLPQVYDDIERDVAVAENYYGAMQDMEIVVSRGRLYFIQTRDGMVMATPLAKTRILVDLADAGAISKEEAFDKMQVSDLEWLKFYLEQPVIKETSWPKAIAKGIPLFPGIARAKIFMDNPRESNIKEGTIIGVEEPFEKDGYYAQFKKILKHDIRGIASKEGGYADHAAVAIRKLNKRIPYVILGEDVIVDEVGMHFKNVDLDDEDEVVLDGNTGRLYRGEDLNENDFEDSEVTKALWGDKAAAESDYYRIYQTVLRWIDLKSKKQSFRDGGTGDEPDPNSLLYILTGNKTLGMLGMALEAAGFLALGRAFAEGGFASGASGPYALPFMLVTLIAYSLIHAVAGQRYSRKSFLERFSGHLAGFLPYLLVSWQNPLLSAAAVSAHFIRDVDKMWPCLLRRPAGLPHPLGGGSRPFVVAFARSA